MWCGTRQQLRELGWRIRREFAATPDQRAANESELRRLRQVYDIRRSTLIDPR
jgi:hypothetical protein